MIQYDAKVITHPLQSLGLFSSLLYDYYHYGVLTTAPPSYDALVQAKEAKKHNYTQRSLIEPLIRSNYPSLPDYDKLNNHLEALKLDALAVTTAHQPNLFLGPFYIISKAISTIALANRLTAQWHETIVPIFVIGAEDHDQDELLNTFVGEASINWPTTQTGAVGQMIIDETFEPVRMQYEQALGKSTYAKDLVSKIQKAYQPGHTIAQAMQILLTDLFGEYGLVVFDINIREVKQAMLPFFERELKHQWVINTTREDIEWLKTNYHVQAPPRPINLFEFENGNRVRIERYDNSKWPIYVSKPEVLSPNVMLRPLMQQLALPSIANIGGAAEVAYWLEQTSLFDSAQVSFPVLLMRDIFGWIDEQSYTTWTQKGLDITDMMLNEHELSKKLATLNHPILDEIAQSQSDIDTAFDRLHAMIAHTDPTLLPTLGAQKLAALKALDKLYLKWIKAQKRKDQQKISKMIKIQKQLVENGALIERKQNFGTLYSELGIDMIESMIKASDVLALEWKVIVKP